MAQTKEGAAKAAETMRAKFGENFHSVIGAKGGKNGRGYAFAHGKVSPAEAGKLGGRPRNEQRTR